MAAKAGLEAGEEPSEEDEAYLAGMEAHLCRLRQRRDASKSPEIRYVGSITKEQQLEKDLLVAEDTQAKLAVQANESRKALQAAADKTAKLREDLKQAKLNTVRDAAQAGVSAPPPEQAAQTMVVALAEQYGAVGSGANPELTAFLLQSAASIAAALQKFSASQPGADAAADGNNAMDTSNGTQEPENGAANVVPPTPSQAPPPVQAAGVQAAGATGGAPKPANAATLAQSRGSAASSRDTAVTTTDQTMQEEKPSRVQASAEDVANAKPHGVALQTDSERVQNLRSALRANLEMGCSVLELQTCVDAITGALANDEERLDTGPKAKQQRATEEPTGEAVAVDDEL